MVIRSRGAVPYGHAHNATPGAIAVTMQGVRTGRKPRMDGDEVKGGDRRKGVSRLLLIAKEGFVRHPISSSKSSKSSSSSSSSSMFPRVS